MCDQLFHVSLNVKTKGIEKVALKLGNKYYSKGHFFIATILYNQMISHARSKKDLSLAYASRSAIFYDLELYDECLQNIQWARDNKYPEHKYPQLDEREKLCKEKMNEKIDKNMLWDIFKLSYPAKKNNPWIADCVEVKTTEKYGRGIYATRDLQPGDVICIEDLVVNFRDINYEYTHCYNCFKPNLLNLIPCRVSGHMMFCSEACRDDLYDKSLNIDGIVSLDVKMLSDIVKGFGSVEKFNDFMLNTDLKDLNKTIFDFDFTNPEDPDYKKNLMTCLLSLSSDENYEPPMCCGIHDYVPETTVQRILSIYFLNKSRSYIYVNKNEYLEVGWHVSLFSSLVNHSCLNNAFTVLVENKLATVIHHPVKAGEQIFFNYMTNARETRTLQYIEELHNFKCDCKLCMVPKTVYNKCLRNKILHEMKGGKVDVIPFDLKGDPLVHYLKRQWEAIKNVPIEQKYEFINVIHPLAALDFVAGKNAYPFV